MKKLWVYAGFYWLNDFRYISDDASPMEYYRRTAKKSICKEIFSFSDILTFSFRHNKQGFSGKKQRIEMAIIAIF